MPAKMPGKSKARTRAALNARQEAFCKAFIACGIASQAYQEAGYRCTPESLNTHPARLVGSGRVKERIAELQAQKDARLMRKEITKENLVERMWEHVHAPDAKRGESIQAGIAVAKMVGWNAPTRVEHDLGDKVRAYLEDIRSRPLRTLTHSLSHSKPIDAQVVDVQRE